MTGFGRAKKSYDGFDVTVEIKSVNHRYFEFSCRIPRAYAFLEDKVKTRVQKRVSRGKVEASVMLEITDGSSVRLEVDRDYADACISALRRLGKEYKLKDDLKLSNFAGNSDILVVKRKEIAEELLVGAVTETVDAALDAFVDMRAAEGERLKDDIMSRAAIILEKVAFVESRSPETVREYRNKLEQRIRELIGDVKVDEQRLLTETAVFADKIAVDEETVRLRSHIEEMTGHFENGGPIGRRLDFIVQEMNREANTTGSKCSDIEITRAVVEIKAQLEKIREQVQNIE